MRITAVYDRDGAILAAVVNEDAYDGPKPVPEDGMEVGTFEVPKLHEADDLALICTRLRVDMRSKRELVDRDAAG